MTNVKVLGTMRARLGEGLIWSVRDNALIWVDILSGYIIRTDPYSGSEQRWSVGEPIGCIVEDPDSNHYLAALKSGFAHVRLDPESNSATLSHLIDPEPDLPDNRFNDGAVDPDGNFWAGTMDDDEVHIRGRWWRRRRNGQIASIGGLFHVANGPAFSPDRRWVYLTDSAKRIIYRGRYDSEAGMTAPAPWRTFDESHGYPDGMCFDDNGLLWIAFWDGACLRALDHDGAVVHQIGLPVMRPTKIAFTPDGRCFVTTAASITCEYEPDQNQALDGRLIELSI